MEFDRVITERYSVRKFKDERLTQSDWARRKACPFYVVLTLYFLKTYATLEDAHRKSRRRPLRLT